MDKDISRDRLEIKMFCSRHPDVELCFSTDSSIGASSAYSINGKILIHPCRRCRQEIERIEDAARVLMAVANNK